MANEKLVNRENLKAFRQAYDNRLEDGQLVPALTKGIEAISTESGSIQDTPFILQGTGTANGSSIVDTAPIGKHLEKQGNVVCVNQLVQNGNFVDTSGWNFSGSFSVSNNIASLTASSQYANLYKKIDRIASHKYLAIVDIKPTTTSTNIIALQMNNGSTWVNAGSVNSSSWKTYYLIFEQQTNTLPNDNSRFVQDNRTSDWDTIQVKNAQLVDLTQWFNGDIPQDLLDHPEHWSWYQNYGNYIAYNTGTLVASNGRYLECGGRNIWDEQWELGEIDTTSGAKISGSRLISKNYIRVIQNTQYYIKQNGNGGCRVYYYDKDKNYIGYSPSYLSQTTFTISSNCSFIKFQTYNNKTSYDAPITISLYYATGEGYNEYYPYEQPKVYDTGTETLLKAGSVKDYKVPSGLITRPVGGVDLGTLNWSKYSGTFYADVPTKIARGNGYNKISILCVKYTSIACNSNMGTENGDKVIWEYRQPTPSKRICINDSSISTAEDFATAMNGVYLYCELETPTTEQGTPFAENIEINDYGTMGWLDTNNAYVDIPQGCKIFYPADYVLFIDSLGQRTDIEWDASKIVSHTELQASETQRDTVDTQLKNAIGGTLRQCLCVAKSLSFNNTDVVDLGTLTGWYKDDNVFVVYISLGIKDFNWGSPNVLCSKYRAITTLSLADLKSSSSDKLITFNGSTSSYIYIKDSSYTNIDDFKNSLKGVLLAYEKA